MPLKLLTNLDISTPEEEKMIQEIVLARTIVPATLEKFNQRLVPDIKNPEQEKEWQNKIDKFNSENTPIEAKIVRAEKVLEEIKIEVVSEKLAVPEVVTVKNGEIVKPFCDQCSSKGVRHKKECPTNNKV